MTGSNYLAFILVAAAGLVACRDGDVGQAAVDNAASTAGKGAAAKAEDVSDYDGTVTQPGSPFGISYRIIGTPIVGNPVTLGLRLQSAQGPRPLTLDYRINDASSMIFAESQLASVQLQPAANENYVVQQVTVVPQREGRLYLNVSASFQTEDGTMSTVAAIPVQVGSGGRPREKDGDLQFDEDGDAVRVLAPD